jgi:membrane-associated phospholipid phosphatase
MEIVHWLHQVFGGRAEPLFLGITYLGSSATLWAVIVLGYWLFDPRLARRLGVVLALSEVSNQLLKSAFGSSRPYDLDTELSSDLARRTGGGHGFPSGHAQNNAAFWFSLGFCFRRRWVWGLAFFAVAAVALSRLVLGVHMPVDVVGGVILGSLIAWLGSRMPLLTFEVPRRVWGPGIAAAGLALSFLGIMNPRALALLAAVLLSRPAFVPPRTWGRRLAMALGGIACLAAGYALIGWLPGRLAPRWPESPAGAYLIMLALAWVALEGWPRLWERIERSPHPRPLSHRPWGGDGRGGLGG